MSIKNKIRIITRTRIEDDRGWFLKTINGFEDNLPNRTGEIYFTMATPGNMKGGHYHKKANEWFTLVTGSCILILQDIESNEIESLQLDSKKPQTIFVPPMIAHGFYNISKEDFILQAYSSELYDPTDTIMFELRPPGSLL